MNCYAIDPIWFMFMAALFGFAVGMMFVAWLNLQRSDGDKQL